MELRRPLSPAARAAAWLLGLAGLVVLAIGGGCGEGWGYQAAPTPVPARKAPVENRIADSETKIKTLQADQDRLWTDFRRLDQQLNGLDINNLDSWTQQQRDVAAQRQSVHDSIIQKDRDIRDERTRLDSLTQEKTQNDAAKPQPRIAPATEAARDITRPPMPPPVPPRIEPR
jgi:hypothetical protein